ncbi:hypothetical protein ACO0K0_05075 [Undibacterium sp. SXout11W]|uniref:hypothetical protein n=1 Tax=Undibacterium sp. SXout11W TaxID=3413050 RepID=UPI003BF0FBCE
MKASIKFLVGAALTIVTCMSQAGVAGLSGESSAEKTANNQKFEGDWNGTLAGALHLVLHVKKSASGEYTAVLESVDQGHAMIPVDKLDVSAEHLFLSVNAVKGIFDAKWDDKTNAWIGTWTQGQQLPLILSR